MQHNKKDRQPNTAPFHSARDLDIVLEETVDTTNYNNGYLENMLNTPYSSNKLFPMDTTNLETRAPLLPLRRARAGTMPSVIYMDHHHHQAPLQPQQPQLPPVAFPVVTNSAVNRHRSGSLTLPVPATYAAWRPSTVEPTSPSTTEQLLQQGDDIARTLRSIGLDDDKDGSGSSPLSSASNSIATPPTGGSPSANLLHQQRNTLRSRSYSVNNAAMYQQQQQQQQQPQPQPLGAGLSNGFSLSASSMENILMSSNGHRGISSRPRASSMGKMDYNTSTPPGLSSLWKMQLGTLEDDSIYESNEENIMSLEQQHSLSLGDSELLANMLHINGDSSSTMMEPDINNNNHAAINTEFASVSMPTTPAAVTREQLSSAQQPSNLGVSRSLWVGNIDASVTMDNLSSAFSMYGPIESVRLLLEKECAFINYYHIDDAVRAKDDVLTNLGGRIGNCIVRIGYGRAENVVSPITTAIETPVVSQPTRALWLGNMPPGISQSALQRTLSSFGVIESVRVLSHKNCAFINFEKEESAKAARDALIQNDPNVKELWGIRIGFAKVPINSKAANSYSKLLSKSLSNEDMLDGETNWELWGIMKRLGAPDAAMELVKSLQSSSYFESIPPVPEYGLKRRHDAAKLREIRKRLDSVTSKDDHKEADSIALDCMDEIAEICSDYIGNTVAQRLFEKCSEDVKTLMLQAVAPHLAAMGVHKNGTWAAQKIIDSLNTQKQIQIVCAHIQPFIPPLLLDQYGNYVVQCCLRLDGDTQFIMNAMVEKFLHIAQGRFGARAMRGILEGSLITSSQQIFIAAALLQNAVSLAIHANGALLISWLIDCSTLENRLSLLASQLVPCLVQVATHKLGSQIMLKLINQDNDPEARQCLYNALNNTETMTEVLSDQARGLNFALKVISSDYLSSDERTKLREMAHPILTQWQGTSFKKALLEFSPSAQ
ncbi:glutamine--fructose-6-phosphate transaminase (isomerizing) [Mucor velutinosus]|uniref:Glutamine--fructose-6-phosphate transaminase (Isomerizing) n=1 Tax=Mucor velutinosus TaxID=708070 RepID=A0AAN7D8W3_9FUNG|nr:glutamine--fructose-6-phosphate transaminase (isomerizing) [Mucor velutinosus]